MSLFKTGCFNLHSGGQSRFKIDCDELSDHELKALTEQLLVRLPLFGAVEGVPTGGLRLAEALRPWASECIGKEYPLLIVDDVYTTGGSMEEFRAGRPAIGAVLFARKPIKHDWITALFTMSELP